MPKCGYYIHNSVRKYIPTGNLFFWRRLSKITWINILIHNARIVSLSLWLSAFFTLMTTGCQHGPPRVWWKKSYGANLRHCIGGIVVSIAAFQAVDPGSIPGQCNSFVFCGTVECRNGRKTLGSSDPLTPRLRNFARSALHCEGSGFTISQSNCLSNAFTVTLWINWTLVYLAGQLEQQAIFL